MPVPIYSYCGRLPLRRNEVRQERQPPPGCPFAVPERSRARAEPAPMRLPAVAGWAPCGRPARAVGALNMRPLGAAFERPLGARARRGLGGPAVMLRRGSHRADRYQPMHSKSISCAFMALWRDFFNAGNTFIRSAKKVSLQRNLMTTPDSFRSAPAYICQMV